MNNNAILTDTGYLVNFLQKGAIKPLTLSLSDNSLKITSDNKEILADIPLGQIKSVKATNLFFAMFLSTQGTNLEIRTVADTYKISWKNVDKAKVYFRSWGQIYTA